MDLVASCSLHSNNFTIMASVVVAGIILCPLPVGFEAAAAMIHPIVQTGHLKLMPQCS